MLKELFPSDMHNVPFESSLECFSFYPTKNMAINHLNREIVLLEDQISFFGWYEKGKLIILVQVSFLGKQMTVKNALVINQFNKKFISVPLYQCLNTIAKRFRMDEIRIKIAKQTPGIHEELIKKGFVFIEDLGYQLILSYYTGLVLGGGGARGAYQIGVWKALKQLGISFEMVSGTSVGALNGCLMIQGNLKSAETMWSSITTEKVMLIPTEKIKKSANINKLVNELEKVTLTAIKDKGISTKPLLNLIRELLIPEKVMESKCDFYIVTTTLPTMEEKVVSLKEMHKETLSLWLLASASFFPVMQATLIEGHYYIDGGYRNNIPKDVLIKRGVSELIVVDVEGPGVTKLVKVPKDVVETTLKSSWGLGNVLLFDGERSSWNMSLGFLETKKAFGHYKGMSYTFVKEGYKKKSLVLSRAFFSFLNAHNFFSEWFAKKSPLKIWTWLSKNNLAPEFVGITLMESLAKKLLVDPAHVFEIDELCQVLSEKMTKQKVTTNKESNQMMYSFSELVKMYLKDNAPINEYQLMMYQYQQLKKNEPKNKENLFRLMDLSWYTALEALFLLFLEERKT